MYGHFFSTDETIVEEEGKHSFAESALLDLDCNIVVSS